MTSWLSHTHTAFTYLYKNMITYTYTCVFVLAWSKMTEQLLHRYACIHIHIHTCTYIYMYADIHPYPLARPTNAHTTPPHTHAYIYTLAWSTNDAAASCMNMMSTSSYAFAKILMTCVFMHVFMYVCVHKYNHINSCLNAVPQFQLHN